MRHAQQLEQSHLGSTAHPEERSRGNADWWWFGTITGITLLIELALAGRLLVQLSGQRGFLADAAYYIGGIFQRPFGAPPDRVTHTVFELETVVAIGVYASIAAAIPAAWMVTRMLILGWHVTCFGARLSYRGALATERYAVRSYHETDALCRAAWRRAEPVLVEWNYQLGLATDEACRRLYAETREAYRRLDAATEDMSKRLYGTTKQTLRSARETALEAEKTLVSEAQHARFSGLAGAEQARFTAAVMAESSAYAVKSKLEELDVRIRTLGPAIAKPDKWQAMRPALRKVEGWLRSVRR